MKRNNSRGIVINERSGRLELLISAKSAVSVALACMCLGVLFALVFFFPSLITVVAVAFFILLAVRELLWSFRGAQLITIADGNIQIGRKGDFLCKPRSFNLDGVGDMWFQWDDERGSKSELLVHPSFRIYRYGGAVVFDWRGAKVVAAEELSREDGVHLIEIIDEWLARQR